MPHIYFGWFVVAAAVVIYSLIIGSTFAAFGLFVLPVSGEFELSRADMNTGLIVLNLGNAMLAPFIGRLLDRQPAKRIMVTGSILLGTSLVALGLSRSLMLDVVLIAFPVAIGVLGAGTISISVLVARWFTAYRGRAMALASTGLSLGAIVVTPIVGWLITTEGWRTALILVGAGVGLLLTVVTASLRERPGPGDVETRNPPETPEAPPPSTDILEPHPPSAGAILRMPLFWALALGIALGSGVNQGLMVSLVPLALESGLSMMQAASLISVTGIAGIVAMLILAVFADKTDRTILLSILICSAILPSALLLVANDLSILMLTAVVIGLSLAVIAPLYIALLADRFGLAAFGTVRGLIVPVMSLAGAGAVRFIGEVYDRTGGYETGLWTFIVIDLIAAGLVLSSRYIQGGEATPR